MDTTTHKIRPSGRHLMAIGRDLIQSQHAAIVELVKNAYDADASYVEIDIHKRNNSTGMEIVVTDDGHGMTSGVVVGKWLVPSTDDKLKRKKSPKNRVMQGRKGVGRYAAALLGETLKMQTVTADGWQTELALDWEKFEAAEFLDDVDVNVSTSKVETSSGTVLRMRGDSTYAACWDDRDIYELQKELKKLLSPLTSDFKSDPFEIFLSVSGFDKADVKHSKLEPLPIFEYYDYKISGRVSADGNAELTFTYSKIPNHAPEKIAFDIKERLSSEHDKDIFLDGVKCGALHFDVRVYDREVKDIDRLVSKLRSRDNAQLGKNEARRLLTEFSGIGVYRNNFRIRPLGDAGYDWLHLEKKRVQNPSRKIGLNQVIGYITIQAEEVSGLEEKTARDGLKENKSYKQLVRIAEVVLNELEMRRYRLRRTVGRKVSQLETKVDSIMSMDSLRENMQKALTRENVSDESLQRLNQLIDSEEEKRQKIYSEFKRAIAVYQGQATVGKIVNVVLHEGRRPLDYFKNNVGFIPMAAAMIVEDPQQEIIDDLNQIAVGFDTNTTMLLDLFNKIDPLATGRRKKSQPVSIKQIIDRVKGLFEHNLLSNHISLNFNSEDYCVTGWEQDLVAIFTNLVDNSVFWLGQVDKLSRSIDIGINIENGKLESIIYTDTGPGIDPELVREEVIFEPDFSTRHDSKGLGLAIAGEAADRNGLVLSAVESETGACFILREKGDGDV